MSLLYYIVFALESHYILVLTFYLTPAFLAVFLALKDPTDKWRTVCDDKLKELFEVDSFNGFLSLRCSDYSFSSRWDKIDAEV